MNYLKDRYSYITARGEPAFIRPNVFRQSVPIDKKVLLKTYICWCGEDFEFYDQIKKHRKKSGHFVDRPNNVLNNEQ